MQKDTTNELGGKEITCRGDAIVAREDIAKGEQVLAYCERASKRRAYEDQRVLGVVIGPAEDHGPRRVTRGM